jgi:aerobic carbon-monoxide dehydrogenase medium subunit
MTPFDLAEPTSLRDAIRLLDRNDPSVRPIAGGTALMLMMKAGVFKPTRLVSLAKVGDGLARIETTPAGDLTIGAMTPLSVVERSVRVLRTAPLIAHTMKRLSNIRVRNVATVGGNIAHADPHMDLPPVLIALAATVTITSLTGERKLPIEDLFTGYFATVIAGDELITALHVPSQGNKRVSYLKCTTGSAEDWPALGIAVALDVEGKRINSARVVVSAATEKATRLAGSEKVLAGASVDDKLIDDKLLARAGEAATEEADIMADVRGSVPYKRELLRVYLARAVRQALDIGGAS